MGIYFGTDGIRGNYGSFITPSLAYKCGCSLAGLCTIKKVLIARDTRISGDVLSLSVANGLMSCGIDVIDIGIAPTPVASFLTEKLGCDFGVVVSASHNPPIDNGIKIFDRFGYKITEEEENKIENFFSFSHHCEFENLGRFSFRPDLVSIYKKEVVGKIVNKNSLRVVFDCANGATFKLAKQIFPKVCKETVFIADKNDGLKINDKCGALHPENLIQHVKSNNADLGFAFDGDGDRIVMCDRYGRIYDGDDILCILSSSFECSEIVGTTMTNKGFEDYLSSKNITLVRSDVGDKYVAEIMRNKNICLGGEPSGHIIIKSFSKTGDGIWTAFSILKVLSSSSLPIQSLVPYKKYPQVNCNVEIQDKFRILNSETLKQKIAYYQKLLKNKGRILVRASGTENKIRIMCECAKENLATKITDRIKEIILQIK